MQLNKIALLFLFVSLGAHGASFDCEKVSTEVEKTICADKWLGELDEELVYFYTKLRDALPKAESSELLTRQREWVRERNNVCEAADNKISCLNQRYKKRINELKIQYEEPLLPDTEELSSICSEIANLDSSRRREYGDVISTGDISRKLVSYDINNDGFQEIAESCYSGTMNTPCIEFKLADGSTLNISTINYEWKDYWTYGLKVFNKNGLWYSLHSYDDNLVKPAYISYLTPENNEYVVCEFENKEVEQVIPNSENEAANGLCQEITNEDSTKIKNSYLADKPTISSDTLRSLGRYETGLRRQGFLDYNNDGILNYIGELIYSSGAGRGCDYNYFDELSADKKSFMENELLLKMQKVSLEGRLPNCGSLSNGEYMNHFFEFENKNYFEYKTQDDRAVYKIESNQIHEVCSFKKTYDTKVKSIGIPNK